MTASIGVALLRAHGAEPTAEELLVEADIAMYDAKEAGRDRVAVYDAARRSARAHAARASTWADRIRRALDEDRFRLYCQPIVDLRNGRDGPARAAAADGAASRAS